MSLVPRKLLSALALSVLAFAPTASALPPETTDARAIMEAVEARERGDKSVGVMKMVISDGAGAKRERIVRTRSMEFTGGTKTLMLFESPADVRNTGLLSVDYDDGAKDDDQWLYLPSLRKTTRISSGEKSGSFLGTDLTYADMTKRDPKNYDYTMLDADAKVGDEACWKIEARPKHAKEREETGYVKSEIWISKSKLLPLQTRLFVREGKKIKLIKFDAIRQVSGLWTPHKITAWTTRGGKTESMTVIVYSSLKYGDPSVSASDFEQRRLEQGL